MIKVFYNSPAVPQHSYNVKVGAHYDCVKENNQYFIIGTDYKQSFSLEFIKMMFKPCDGYNWDILEKETNIEQENTQKVKTPKRKQVKDGG